MKTDFANPTSVLEIVKILPPNVDKKNVWEICKSRNFRFSGNYGGDYYNIPSKREKTVLKQLIHNAQYPQQFVNAYTSIFYHLAPIDKLKSGISHLEKCFNEYSINSSTITSKGLIQFLNYNLTLMLQGKLRQQLYILNGDEKSLKQGLSDYKRCSSLFDSQEMKIKGMQRDGEFPVHWKYPYMKYLNLKHILPVNPTIEVNKPEYIKKDNIGLLQKSFVFKS